MTSTLALLRDLADAILGHHCRLGCGQRVFVKDVGWHEGLEHAGDVA